MNRHRRSIFWMLVLEMVIIGVLIVVGGCTTEPTPTETPSPITTPTPNTSPLPTPQAEAEGRVVVLDELKSEEETSTMKMSPELLANIAGVALSLFFSYVPKFNTWYDALDAIVKRLIMAGLLLLVAAGIYGLSCAGVITGFVECTQDGLMSTIGFFIDAIIANQAAYLISPKRKVA